jgi:cell division protein FtsN
MNNARFRLMAGLAGATLCLFAATAYGQTPNATTSAPATTSQPTGNAAGTATPDAQTGAANTQVTPDAGTTTTGTVTGTTATDAVTTTTTTTRSFPGGTLGMLAVAVLVLLVLFALFRGRDRTVVRETYASSSTTGPGTRNVTTGTASDDRMNLNSRAASGTGTQSGINDPNARQ